MLPEAFDTLWALSALRVAVESGMLASVAAANVPRSAVDLARDAGLDRSITTRIGDVLVAFGVFDTKNGAYVLTDKGRALAGRGDALRADLAVTFGQTRALVAQAARGTLASGWRHDDPEVIRAQADLSYAMTQSMTRPIAEAWPELHERLGRDGARLVDIGVGGAGGACALCKQFPKLRIVGVDPLPAALAEARANVAKHDLGARIELRAQRGDELPEEASFDIAFLAAKFLDDHALESTLRVLAKALRPDGLIMTMAWRDVGEPRATAISKLRDEMWGAGPRPTEAVTAMLERAGFSRIRIGPPMGTMQPILAGQ